MYSPNKPADDTTNHATNRHQRACYQGGSAAEKTTSAASPQSTFDKAAKCSAPICTRRVVRQSRLVCYVPEQVGITGFKSD
jgi:hypothetical protein